MAELAELYAEQVVVPTGINCCGFRETRDSTDRNPMPRPWPACASRALTATGDTAYPERVKSV